MSYESSPYLHGASARPAKRKPRRDADAALFSGTNDKALEKDRHVWDVKNIARGSRHAQTVCKSCGRPKFAVDGFPCEGKIGLDICHGS